MKLAVAKAVAKAVTTTAALAGAIAITLTGIVAVPVCEAQDHGVLAREAGAKFRKNCMQCHQPPDLRFETDRAWLGQIERTA